MRFAWLLILTLATPNIAMAGSTVLSNDELRIDFGPTGFSILNSGAIGGLRGISVVRAGGATGTGLGLGASYGVSGRAELGVLFLPLDLSNGGRYGDITAHARYRLLGGTTEIAAQAAVRIPTRSTFGLGLGAPIVLHLNAVDIETGVEVELIFREGGGADANLDVPIAILFNINRAMFAGVRTGLFFPRFDELDIVLGGVIGAHVSVSNAVSIDPVASFVFNRFITTGVDSPISLASWILQVGVVIHLQL